MSPQKPVGFSGASVISGHASQCYLSTFRDQHAHSNTYWAKDGRPWWGWREFAANRGDIDAFNSPLWPGDHEAEIKEQWNAPFMPDPIWFEFNWRKQTIRIRYDRMISHYDQAAEVYYRRVNRMCDKHGWPMVSRGELPRDAITDVHGDPPLSSRIFRAAQASHPWILGFSNEPDEELARLMHMTIPGAGIYHAPRKEGLVPVDQTTMQLSDDDIDERIARAVARALEQERQRQSQERSDKIKAGMAAKKQTAGSGAP